MKHQQGSIQSIESYISGDAVGQVAYFAAIDAMRHMLKGDHEQTRYKDPNPARKYLARMQKALGGSLEDPEGYTQAQEGFTPHRRWRRERRRYSGDLDIEAYINSRRGRDRQDVWQGDERIEAQKPALTIALNCAVPHCQRDWDYMVDRQRRAYEIATRAESEGRPCRIVGCIGQEYQDLMTDQGAHTRNPALRKDVHVVFFVTKDYTDGIWPGMWAILKNNRTTNAMINCYADYVTGTSEPGNGPLEKFDIVPYLDDISEDFVLIGDSRTEDGGNLGPYDSRVAIEDAQ